MRLRAAGRCRCTPPPRRRGSDSAGRCQSACNDGGDPAGRFGRDAARSDSPAPPATGPVVPTFDVVRVEADGSVVVAGKAAPDALVELLNDTQVLGNTDRAPKAISPSCSTSR